MNRHALILLAVMLAPVGPKGAVRNDHALRSVTLLYTSGAQGQIRSCNCTKFRFGGYGRELTLLKSVRKESPDSVLIEGGDMLEWTSFLSGLKSEVTGRAIKLLGYQALVPGENEIGRPEARAIDKLRPSSVPFVCANLLDENKGKPGFQPYIVLKTTSGGKIGVIGLLSKSVGRGFQEQDFQSSVTDPATALNKALPAARKLSDLVVVVFHGPAAEAEQVAAVKGVDLVLVTHRLRRDLLFPEKGSNEVTAPVRTVKGVTFVESETHENWSLGRIDLSLDGAGRIISAKHKLTYLDRSFSEDPEMVAVYEEYNGRVKDAVLSQSSEFRSKAEALLSGRGFNLIEMRKRLRAGSFVTAEKCKSCHPEIHEIWSQSRHANAMETLKKTHQEFDPECVNCHTTGTLKRGGYSNLRDTPELANVQCEACHGPGKAHAESPKKGYGNVQEQVCRSCHTDERTPDFDFEQSWAHIMH